MVVAICHCQMFVNGETIECAFLVGAKCMANPKRPFHIDSRFHNQISVVGCQSFQRYLDYAKRREKFGEESVEQER